MHLLAQWDDEQRTNENQREQTRANENKREQTRTNESKREQTRSNENKREQTRTNLRLAVQNLTSEPPWRFGGSCLYDYCLISPTGKHIKLRVSGRAPVINDDVVVDAPVDKASVARGVARRKPENERKLKMISLDDVVSPDLNFIVLRLHIKYPRNLKSI